MERPGVEEPSEPDTVFVLLNGFPPLKFLIHFLILYHSIQNNWW